MERRWHRRIPAHANVVVYYQGIPILKARSRNLSVEGVLVDKTSDLLPRHAPVQIELALPGPGQGRFRLAARVAHTAKGIGLMFAGLNARAADAIRDFLARPMAGHRS